MSILSNNDLVKVATDPGAPYGGGTQSMGGGNQQGSGSPQEANSAHVGPPPAAAGASHIRRCNDCGKVCDDGNDLEEHMRKEHHVRANRNDVTIPAALIFIDALGDTLPFKSSFTFKELNDFCLREGVSALAGTPLIETDLIKIAENIQMMTANHVQVSAEPTHTATRAPLSMVDLNVAERKSSTVPECRRCGNMTRNGRLLCEDCSDVVGARVNAIKPGIPGTLIEEGPQSPVGPPIQLYAYVTLSDGARLHVVDIDGDQYVGVDDRFASRTFLTTEACQIHNLDDDIRTLQASQCDMCGEEMFEFAPKCANCGQARQNG